MAWILPRSRSRQAVLAPVWLGLCPLLLAPAACKPAPRGPVQPGAGSANQTVVLRPTVLVPGSSLEKPDQIAVDARNRVYIGDGQTIVAVGPDGRELGRWGRRGGEPGEFSEITALAPAGPDTLLVWDASEFRLSWYDAASGRLLRTGTVTPPKGFGSAVKGILHAHDKVIWLAWKGGVVRPDGPPDTTVLASHALVGGAGHRAEMGPAMVRGTLANSKWKRFGLEFLAPEGPFGPQPIIAFGAGGTIAFGEGVDYCVNLLARDGPGAGRRFCTPFERAPIGKARQVLSDPELHKDLRAREVIGAIVQAQTYPDVRNSYDALLVDDAGLVWIRIVDANHQYHPMYMGRIPETRPAYYVWEVREPSGRLAAKYSVPSRFEARVIRGGRVYGTYDEPDGTISIRVAGIPAPGTPPPGRPE